MDWDDLSMTIVQWACVAVIVGIALKALASGFTGLLEFYKALGF